MKHSTQTRIRDLVAKGLLWNVGDEMMLHGILYTIENRDTADDREAAGYANLAREMRENGAIVELTLSRKGGWARYSVVMFETSAGAVVRV